MSITVDEYDYFVETTSVWEDSTYPLLGLAGETGEAIDRIKKLWRQYGEDWNTKLTAEERLEVLQELGDIQWYITRILHMVEADLEEMIHENVSKLIKRGRVPDVISMEAQ